MVAEDRMTACDPRGQRAIFDLARQDRRALFSGDRLRKAIAEAGLDAVIAVSPINITYTGGAWVPHPLLLSFVVTTAAGTQGVVINEADEYYFNEYSWISDIRGFRFGPTADSDALALLQELVADLGLEHARVGIELSQMSSIAAEQVATALPNATLEDCQSIFEHTRIVKTEAELELIGLAAYCTDKAIQTAFALSRPGATEKDLAASMQGIALELGADATGHTHVHAGTHSTIVHTLSLERPMVPGEVVHVDFGAAFAGYCTDISRNAVIERFAPRQREIYDRLFEIEQVLIERLRPGTVASEVFELATRQFAAHDLVHPWGTIGHSTGLSIHEGFEFARGAETVLEPGMVVCIEPSHIEQGDARYHIEDTLVITDEAPRVISNFAPIDDIFVIR
jgi:Xaa-Pro aminopeptidase